MHYLDLVRSGKNLPQNVQNGMGLIDIRRYSPEKIRKPLTITQLWWCGHITDLWDLEKPKYVSHLPQKEELKIIAWIHTLCTQDAVQP